MWRGLLAVAIGATLGAWLRWGLGAWLNPIAPSLPVGTLIANLVGGYLIGVAAGWFGAQPQISLEWRLLIVTGFLGALTTFSTFSAESVALLQRGELGAALLHSGAHLFGSLLMTALGLWSVHAMQSLAD
jgi:fluoride exporter